MHLTMKQKSFEVRAKEYFSTRIEELKGASRSEEAREDLESRILAISKTLTVKIELSYGGPADGFIVEVEPETREIIRAKHYFVDWFKEPYETELNKEQVKELEQFISGYLEVI